MNDNLEKAREYCSRAEHCIEEVKKKLWDWKVPAEEHEEILKRLVEETFINEGRYARAYANDKFKLNHWGRNKIRMMLRYKKIDVANIDDAISCIDEEEYTEVIRKLVESEMKRVKAASEYERKMKVVRNLAAKGFESSLVGEFIS